MRIGILGGTFDPVHNGHIYLAERVSRKLKLSWIIFIPSYIPPHKKGAKVTPARHRYAMLKLAIGGHRGFRVSDMEIKRKGRSYSVETLRRLRKRFGARTALFFITGSDSLRELYKWKDMEEILTLCEFVIVERPGFKAGRIPEGFAFLKVGAKNISATSARNSIRKGRPLRGIVPQKVEDYIRENKLYI
ncbi:MAG: nicotinate-nucleotide adenylyltransferase [Candidatus Omnitrophota bacterium]|jgi:nicotinate-nucleotide adenylyltransferase